MSIPGDVGRDWAAGSWRLDPARSNVEFHTRTLWGLSTVKGHFERYDGTFDLSAEPAIRLNIEAGSLNTNNKRRDEDLRSANFFDVANHPQVQYLSDAATLDGDRLKVRGRLFAAGNSIPLELDATLRRVDGDLEIEATTQADHRRLGMTWNRIGMIRAPSTLMVRGRLVKET